MITRELRKESFPMCAMTNHYKPGALKGIVNLSAAFGPTYINKDS